MSTVCTVLRSWSRGCTHLHNACTPHTAACRVSQGFVPSGDAVPSPDSAGRAGGIGSDIMGDVMDTMHAAVKGDKTRAAADIADMARHQSSGKLDSLCHVSDNVEPLVHHLSLSALRCGNHCYSSMQFALLRSATCCLRQRLQVSSRRCGSKARRPTAQCVVGTAVSCTIGMTISSLPRSETSSGLLIG